MIASQWPYIISAWIITGASIGAYTAWVLRRGRELSRRVVPEKRRWM